MSSISGDDQSLPEKLLTEFVTLAVNSKGEVDPSELADKLRVVSPDRRLQCLSSVHGKNGRHLVHEASWKNMAGVVDCIRTYLGSEPFCTLVGQADNYGWLPLHYAFASAKRGVSQHFVEKMVDLLLSSFDDENRSRLIKQAISGVKNLLVLAALAGAPSLALKILRFLSESDQVEMLRTKDPQANTALHWLFNRPDKSDFTKHLCQMIPHQQMVELLKVENMQGFTPLHMASMHSGNVFSSLLSILKQEEVECFAGRSFGEVPFLYHMAERSEQEYLILMVERLSGEVLLDSMHQTSLGGLTLLHLVSGLDKVNVLEAISTRVSPDQFYQFSAVRDEFEKCPLHYAVENEAWNVVNFLTNKLPCKQLVKLLDMQDEDGNTPFNSIVEKGNEGVKTLLLQKIFPHLAPTQQAGGKGNAVDAGHYDSEAGYERPEGEFEDDRNTDVFRGLPEVINLQERISELEKEVQVKDSLVEELRTKTAKLEHEIEGLKKTETDSSHHTKSSQVEGPPEVMSLKERVSELEEQVRLKDSQLEEREEELARLRKLVDEDDSSDTTGSEPPGPPKCDDDDDDDESLEDYSKFDDHDIPEGLHNDLVRLCDKRQVSGYQFYQNPADFNEIVVTGRNTSNFKPDDFENVRGERWREYTISAEEEEMDCYTEQHTDIRQFAITQLKGTCELIVEALDANRKRRKYAVGSAHCMFPREKNLQLQKGNNLVQARQDVQQNPAGKHYKIRFKLSPDQFKVIDAYHPPIFSYRYQHDRGAAADPASCCLNDLVLLRIRNRKAEGLQSELRRDLFSRRERLVKFEEEGKLNKYIRPNCEEYKIQVKKQFGCLIRNPQGLEAQRRAGNGICLLFKLDEGSAPLEYGDSGSIVFEVRNGRLRPLGLYIGMSQRPFTRGCYQAAILDLCFKDIKRENPDHLTTVPVLNDQCPERIAANRYNQPQDT